MAVCVQFDTGTWVSTNSNCLQERRASTPQLLAPADSDNKQSCSVRLALGLFPGQLLAKTAEQDKRQLPTCIVQAGAYAIVQGGDPQLRVQSAVEAEQQSHL